MIRIHLTLLAFVGIVAVTCTQSSGDSHADLPESVIESILEGALLPEGVVPGDAPRISQLGLALPFAFVEAEASAAAIFSSPTEQGSFIQIIFYSRDEGAFDFVQEAERVTTGASFDLPGSTPGKIEARFVKADSARRGDHSAALTFSTSEATPSLMRGTIFAVQRGDLLTFLIYVQIGTGVLTASDRVFSTVNEADRLLDEAAQAIAAAYKNPPTPTPDPRRQASIATSR